MPHAGRLLTPAAPPQALLTSLGLVPARAVHRWQGGARVGLVEVGVADEDHALDGHEHAPQVGAVRVPLLRLVRAVPRAQQRQAHLLPARQAALFISMPSCSPTPHILLLDGTVRSVRSDTSSRRCWVSWRACAAPARRRGGMRQLSQAPGTRAAAPPASPPMKPMSARGGSRSAIGRHRG